MERGPARSHGRLRRLPAIDGEHQPGRRLHAFRRTSSELAAGAESRARGPRRPRAGAPPAPGRRDPDGDRPRHGPRTRHLAKACSCRELPRTRDPWPWPEPARSPRRPPRAPHGRGLRGRRGVVRARGVTSAMAAPRIRCSVSRPSGARGRPPRTARKWPGHLDAARGPRDRDGGAALLQGARPRMLAQPAAALPGHAAAAVSRTLQDAEAARVADLARRFTTLVRRGSRPVRRGPPRPPWRPRGLTRRGADPRHRGDRDLRRRARARRRRRARGADHAVERRAGRGPDRPPQAHQASVPRPRRLRAPAPPRPPRPPIYTKRRRATGPGQERVRSGLAAARARGPRCWGAGPGSGRRTAWPTRSWPRSRARARARPTGAWRAASTFPRTPCRRS